MSRSQFQSKRFILRHAWLNLWDERMTTGRINQVAIFLQLLDHKEPNPYKQTKTTSVSVHSQACNPCQQQSKLCIYNKHSTNSCTGVLLFDSSQNLISSKTTCNNGNSNGKHPSNHPAILKSFQNQLKQTPTTKHTYDSTPWSRDSHSKGLSSHRQCKTLVPLRTSHRSIKQQTLASASYTMLHATCHAFSMLHNVQLNIRTA